MPDQIAVLRWRRRYLTWRHLDAVHRLAMSYFALIQRRFAVDLRRPGVLYRLNYNRVRRQKGLPGHQIPGRSRSA